MTAKPKTLYDPQAQTEREMIRKLAVILSAIVLAYSIPAKADRLVCSQSEHLRYMKMVGEVGEMGIDLSPVGEDVAAFERLTAAYETLNPKGPKTSLFVAYVPTGQIYSQTCAEERCTMEEMATPEQACLIDHMNQCSYVALRSGAKSSACSVRRKISCLILPSDGFLTA
ncbi:hypothetical protein [Brucella anthropi]